MVKVLIKISFLFLLVFFPWAGKAQSLAINSPDIAVSPLIIDAEGERRDILEYTIKIKNNTNSKASIYPIVNDVNEEGVKKFSDPTELDSSASLVRWLEFTGWPGFDIDPLGETTKEIKIKIAPNAKSGKYHAIIVFGRGSTQEAAAASAEKNNESRLSINLFVKDHIVEKVEVAQLKPTRIVFAKSPAKFIVKLRNIGNVETPIFGKIIAYDNGGGEVGEASLPAGDKIAAGETKVFYLDLKAKGFGKYKVKLLAEYGSVETNRKDLTDITYFVYAPAWAVLFLIIIIFAGVYYLTNKLVRAKAPVKILKKSNDGRNHVIDLRGEE